MLGALFQALEVDLGCETVTFGIQNGTWTLLEAQVVPGVLSLDQGTFLIDVEIPKSPWAHFWRPWGFFGRPSGLLGAVLGRPEPTLGRTFGGKTLLFSPSGAHTAP